MTEVSPIRLWVMRAMYLLMAVGIGLTMWPLIISHSPELPRMNGVVLAMVGTIGLLSLLGLRYPLRMIPLLLFELAWKMIWLATFALPRWLDGTLDEGMRSTIFDTSLGAILIAVIPWNYVWANYVRKPGDSWAFRASAEGAAVPVPAGQPRL